MNIFKLKLIFLVLFSISIKSHSAPNFPSVDSRESQELAYYDNNIVRAWRAPGGNIKFSSPNEIIPQISDKTSKTPALAQYLGKLILAYKSKTGERIYTKEFDGHSWSSTKKNSSTTRDSPSLAVYNGLLYMAFKAKTGGKLMYKTYDGNSWTKAVRIRSASTGDAPSLAVYYGKLHLAYVSDDVDKDLMITSFDGTSWSPSNRLSISTADQAELVAGPNNLRLYYLTNLSEIHYPRYLESDPYGEFSNSPAPHFVPSSPIHLLDTPAAIYDYSYSTFRAATSWYCDYIEISPLCD